MNIIPKVVKFECEIFVEGESPSSSSTAVDQAGNDGVIAGGMKQQQQKQQQQKQPPFWKTISSLRELRFKFRAEGDL